MRNIFLVALALLMLACQAQNPGGSKIDLSGDWHFQMDSLDQGITQKWYQNTLAETVKLPGSMVSNGKGKDISVHSKWTGNIIDSAWFNAAKYAPYRKEGNVKIPFWLQPEKHYLGAAWYQKEVEIPSDWDGKYVELMLERPHWESQLWVDNEKVGMENRLGTPHVYDLSAILSPGKHLLSIRVDNRVKEVDPGQNSHSISDHTQSNWNGIAGQLALTARPSLYLDDVKIYPDVQEKAIKVKVLIKNTLKKQQSSILSLQAGSKNSSTKHQVAGISQEFRVSGDTIVEITYAMGDDFLPWDEFNPNLYSLDIQLSSDQGLDKKLVDFGMRSFKVDKTRFAINDRPVFLRGTLECAIFPETGYPSTDVEEWKRIYKVIKAHGLNHMRFHSWCPPEAAFIAADQVGVYLQVECSSWANQGSSVGDGKPIDKWLYDEAESILDAYGNHPSFCMMAYGNEPGGANQSKFLREFVSHWKKEDPRRVYTGGAGWPPIENQDFYNNAAARIQGWGQELKSIINAKPPQSVFDFRDIIQQYDMPYVSHEIGQWCVYPDLKEIDRYTGVLKAKNFEIFKESLIENEIGHLADSFLLASGKLQALCYKADIEAALRTPGFAGFQLLDLHDFPGQGTALVGVLNPFWEEKGYVTPEEYKRFCDETVPLARWEKRVFLNTESIKAAIEVAHFGEKPLKTAKTTWTITDESGKTIRDGEFPAKDIPIDNEIDLGVLEVTFENMDKAVQYTLNVEIEGFSNSWDFWVYPAIKNNTPGGDEILVSRNLDKKVMRHLEKGGKVLLTPKKGSLKPEKGGDIGIGFSSIFWNTAWTRKQKPHTLGILCDPQHPALAEFPTDYHSNWQWWDAMSHSNAIILDEFTSDLKPVIRVIDDWFENRRLALVFEAKVGEGKIIVSGIDLLSDKENRLEADQLLYSLKQYMAGEDFDPKVTLTADDILNLFN